MRYPGRMTALEVMKMDAPQFVTNAQLDAKALEAWVAVGWLKPEQGADGWQFSDAHLSRARLLQDLTQRFAIDEPGVDAVLDLLDQIGQLRGMLRAMFAAGRALPKPLWQRLS